MVRLYQTYLFIVESISIVFMNLKMVLVTVVVAVLFFLGIIFAIASTYDLSRAIIAVLLFVIGFVLIYLTRTPKTHVQKLEFSGKMKAVALECPNCSASVSTDYINIVSGVPFATCPYCAQTFEIVEEPKW